MWIFGQTLWTEGGLNFTIHTPLSGFPLYFGSKMQGLSRTLKLHFQGPILDESLLAWTVFQQYLISISVIIVQF